MIQAFDFFIHNVNGDAAAERKRRHAGHRRIEIAEVSLPRGAWGERELEKPLSRFFAEGDAVAGLLSELVELELEVGLDVLGSRSEARQREGPEVDAGQQVFAEAAVANGAEQVAVRAGDQLKVAVALAIRPERKKRFSSSARSSIACSSGPSSPISSRNSTPPSAVAQQARAILERAGEGALACGRRAPTWRASPRSVAQFTSTNSPCDLVARLLELEDAAGQLRFAGAGRPHQQERRARGDRHLLDALDQPVERGVARVDAATSGTRAPLAARC